MSEATAKEKLQALQERLTYRFRDPGLLKQALTHRSYLNERPRAGLQDNERLEFLGDAVLGLVVSEEMMRRCPGLSEGELSKRRASVVNRRALAAVAATLDLGSALFLGKGEELSRGRTKTSILADCYEAVLGAVFLEAGYDEARAVITHHLAAHLDEAARLVQTRDYKTQLQELVQRQFKTVPEYHLRQQTGLHHMRVFEFDLFVNGAHVGTGVGKTKKEAEQMAAREALERLGRGAGIDPSPAAR